MRHDVVGRAMRLIADGAVERIGVPGLARRLGYSERHLNRVLTEEVGAGPLAVARAQRAHTARTLIETTELSLTDVAFASGFGSVRQFNDTIRSVYDSTPSQLRGSAAARRDRTSTSRPIAVDGATPITIRLPARAPFDGQAVLAYFAQRLIPGVESTTLDDGGRTVYQRAITCPGGLGHLSLCVGDDGCHVVATIRLSDIADLATVVHRVRRMFDLDADPVAIDTHLGRSSVLESLVAVAPGRRSPGSFDLFETLVRAIVGQQISVAGARTVTGRIVDAVASPLPSRLSGDAVQRAFPSAALVAAAPDEAFSMPTARRDTIRRAAVAIASGDVVLDIGADPAEVRAALLDLKGIGPWTADYVMMRAMGAPDVWLGSDLGVVHAVRSLGIEPAHIDTRPWAPWRSYAVHHLWAHLGTGQARRA